MGAFSLVIHVAMCAVNTAHHYNITMLCTSHYILIMAIYAHPRQAVPATHSKHNITEQNISVYYLFVNDIDAIFSDTSVCMKLFADDVKLYSFFVSSSDDLQIVCDELKKWVDKWQMRIRRIAFNKCTVHRISNQGSRTTGNPVYSIAGNQLGQSNETRDLGIVIDNKLNFNSHISHIAHNAHISASLILRAFVSRDPKMQ